MTLTQSNPPSGASPGEQQGLDHFTGQTGSAGAGKVYMGDTRPYNAQFLNPQAERNLQMRKTPVWMSLNDADSVYYNWSDKQRQDFMAKATVAGLMRFGDGDLEAGKLWHNLVMQASNYGQNDNPVSPMDILNAYVSANDPSKVKLQRQGDFMVNPITGERKYIGPEFKTVTNQRIDFTDPATARAIATKMFQDLMGRNPQPGEIGAFANSLSQAEQANPISEVTTSQYNDRGEVIGNNTVSSGGLSADAKALIAQDQIKKKPEYGVTQAATTLMNALESAIYGAPK